MRDVPHQPGPQHVCHHGQELQQVGSSIKKTSLEDVGTAIECISTSWTGSNSEAYLKKLRLTQERLSGYADKTSKIAGSIESSARRMLTAEQSILNILHK